MNHSLQDTTLALAGILQACQLVYQVAHRGSGDAPAMEASIRSIFELDPPDAGAVYGGPGGVALGLRLVKDQLGERTRRRDFEITKYAISVMHLERKLQRRPELMGRLRSGIERVRAQVQHFSYLHDNVLAALADLYVQTISTLTPRIVVNGEHGHLTNPANVNRVRALLLAAVRSAVLWRQCGGSRLQLLFRRRQLTQAAGRLIV